VPALPWTRFARSRRRRLALAAAALAGALAVAFFAALPDVAALADYRPALASVVVDRHGRPIAEFASERRSLVALADVPPHVVRAFLAAEDAEFHAHPGVDAGAMLRALVANLRDGRIVQGGSTITQQLAKTLFLGPERTLWRKLREAAIALQIERHLAKDQILEIYLNQIYLGSGAYGVAAGARTYFDRAVAELSLGEAALLAGLPKAPSALSPLVNPEGAEERRRWVLERMLALGFAGERAVAEALAEPPRLRTPRRTDEVAAAGWFVEQIRRALTERLGEDAVLRGGLRIETTLDLGLQQRAARALRAGLDASARRSGGAPPAQGALLALEVEGGDVLAWLGGSDFAASPFDRACQARRQPGSAFKTFAYGAAMERGFPPDTLVYDVQYESRSPSLAGGWWRPRNHGSPLRGPVPLAEAFARSLNNASVRLAKDVGIAHIVDFARRAGIRSELPRDLGLALGTGEVTLAELTTAYATFARGGVYAPPRFVHRVLDRDGRTLLEDLALCAPARAAGVSPVDAYLVTHLLSEAVQSWYGTAHDAARLGRAVAGKTGSTNQNRDAWFVGYTPSVAAGVWVGRDDRSPLGPRESGARAALPIWIEVVEAALAGRPPERFARPPGVLFANHDAATGARVVTRDAHPGWVPIASGRPSRRASVAELPPPAPLTAPVFGGSALPEVAAPPPDRAQPEMRAPSGTSSRPPAGASSVTSPSSVTPRPKRTSPRTTRRRQRSSEGGPWGVRRSSSATVRKYFASSCTSMAPPRLPAAGTTRCSASST
jgi:penicillin-binding protein 1A